MQGCVRLSERARERVLVIDKVFRTSTICFIYHFIDKLIIIARNISSSPPQNRIHTLSPSLPPTPLSLVAGLEIAADCDAGLAGHARRENGHRVLRYGFRQRHLHQLLRHPQGYRPGE